MEINYYNDLKENMKEQIKVFEEVLRVNNNFRDSIVERIWDSVNRNIEYLNDLALLVNKIDSKRVEILINISKLINSKDSENLFSLIKKAPHEHRDELIELFYILKSSIIQVKGVFNGISQYVEHKKELSKEIIDILVKDAKGNVYSKPGRRSKESQGFLVNKRL